MTKGIDLELDRTLIPFRYFNRAEIHKGFYNSGDITKALCSIHYEDFFDDPDDDEFPYYSAHQLLCGSCHVFALALQNKFGCIPYVIRGNKGKSFHVFCQIYKEGRWLYIDARGITSSFNEFMDTARDFVNGEYSIRQVEQYDIEEWKNDDKYYSEAVAFAEAMIDKYKDYYCP